MLFNYSFNLLFIYLFFFYFNTIVIIYIYSIYKYIEKSNKEVRNFYWENDFFELLHCLRAEKYKKFKFGFRKEIRLLSSKYPNFSLGFFLDWSY